MIDDIRRENMATLVAEFGGVQGLANKLGRSESQISQWTHGSTHSVTGKQRGMRADSARWISETCGKAPNWLDTDHAENWPSIAALAVQMFALGCPKCGKVSRKSFIELEANDEVPCECGNRIEIAHYYSTTDLETILKSFGGTGFALRKRNKIR